MPADGIESDLPTGAGPPRKLGAPSLLKPFTALVRRRASGIAERDIGVGLTLGFPDAATEIGLSLVPMRRESLPPDILRARFWRSNEVDPDTS